MEQTTTSTITTIVKKETIWVKTWKKPWNRAKSRKRRALLFLEVLKVATGGHFQVSKFRIWLKHPGFSLVSFYAAGPLLFFSESPNFKKYSVFLWCIQLQLYFWMLRGTRSENQSTAVQKLRINLCSGVVVSDCLFSSH